MDNSLAIVDDCDITAVTASTLYESHLLYVLQQTKSKILADNKARFDVLKGELGQELEPYIASTVETAFDSTAASRFETGGTDCKLFSKGG